MPPSTKSMACPALLSRRKQPTRDDHRHPWEIDVDRILHSLTYTRYIDKTQVFYLIDNDHITHRVLHVQFVSRIARTIGRRFGLNEDLIEAVALGHDLGHPPFGHDGEKYLDELCREHGLEPFFHPVMSLRHLEDLERGGRGLNLTLAVLDGILCHDGESDLTDLRPAGPEVPRTFQELDRRREFRRHNPQAALAPMTAEGCLVRLCDVVSYVGRDFEDAITLQLLERRQLPETVKGILGDTNGQIVYHLVTDLIETNRKQGYPGLSGPTDQALTELKNFNRANIYKNPLVKLEADKIRALYRLLFKDNLDRLNRGAPGPSLARFLGSLESGYRLNVPPGLIVRDFIAGMTDAYFLRQATELLLPQRRERLDPKALQTEASGW